MKQDSIVEVSEKVGRTLKLYLVDGTPTGIVTAELGNWTGKLIAAPRAAIKELLDRKEADSTGVYLLMGDDSTDSAEVKIYVGESDCVSSRIKQHYSDENKQFFDRLCLIVSKDENLTKSHVRYLEARILSLIKEAASAAIENSEFPSIAGLLPEPEKADMERFLAEVTVLLPFLGFNILSGVSENVRIVSDQSSYDNDGMIFVLDDKIAKARATEVNGEFVVLAESLARAEETDSLTRKLSNLRKRLEENKTIEKTKDSQHYRFVKNFSFKSPSAASSLLCGMSTNGTVKWRSAVDGQTYKDWQQKQLTD